MPLSPIQPVMSSGPNIASDQWTPAVPGPPSLSNGTGRCRPWRRIPPSRRGRCSRPRPGPASPWRPRECRSPGSAASRAAPPRPTRPPPRAKPHPPRRRRIRAVIGSRLSERTRIGCPAPSTPPKPSMVANSSPNDEVVHRRRRPRPGREHHIRQIAEDRGLDARLRDDEGRLQRLASKGRRTPKRYRKGRRAGLRRSSARWNICHTNGVPTLSWNRECR